VQLLPGDLNYEAALKALQEAVALPFLIRVQISVLLTPIELLP
jgi:hypothetical protein